MNPASNIGTAKIAQEIGKEQMYRAARDFGFGIKAGIGLPGEVSGILKKQTNSGSIVITNPHTGEILAMASQPGFDPNRAKTTPDAWRIRAIKDSLPRISSTSRSILRNSMSAWS